MEIIKKGVCLLVYLKEKDFQDRKCSNTIDMGNMETPRVGDIIFIRQDDYSTDEKRQFKYKVQEIERAFVQNMSTDDLMSGYINVHVTLFDYNV